MSDDAIKAIQGSARAVVACLSNPDEAVDVLSSYPQIRRLWIVCHPLFDRSLFSADSRLCFVSIPAGDVAWPVLAPFLESEPAYFLEGRVAIHVSPEIRRSDPILAAAIENKVLEHTRSVVSRGALRANRGWHMFMNSVLNRSHPAADTLAMLQGAWTGCPVVVVGAGPSLDKNIKDLIPARASIRLVACDGALGTLARYDLVPDLVVSTDDTEKVWRYFANLPGFFSAVPLACVLQSAWPVVRHHAGPILIGRGQGPGDRLLADDFPVFNSGLCVGHAAFEAARLSGAGPIILIGFDLGYAGERFHPKDMAFQYYHDNPPPESNLRFVPGIDGSQVKTDLSMAMYLREFERRFATCNTTVIDATEGGALKRGTRIMKLKDALAEFSTDLISPALSSGSSGAGRWRPPAEWKHQALRLLAVLQQGRLDAPAFLTGLAGGWKNEPGFQPILDLLSGAGNPFLAVAFRFAWEDWALKGYGTCPPPELPGAAAAYAEDLRISTGFLVSLLEMFSGIAWTPDPDRIVCCGFNQGDCESAAPLFRALQSEGFECRQCQVDPDDLPGFWRHIRAEKIGIVLQSSGIVFPAFWAVAGCVCLDWRNEVPSAIVPVEPWLPGYAVVAPAPLPATEWRGQLPPDRAVYSPVNGMAECCCARPFRLAWRELVNSLRKEIEPDCHMR